NKRRRKQRTIDRNPPYGTRNSSIKSFYTFLNNSLINERMCNDTTGVIMDVNPVEQSVRVAFSIRGSLIDVD
ncbi:10782_t:CDS:2, partial [Funneliformis mosseae]